MAVQPQRLVDGDTVGLLRLDGVELPDDRVLGAPADGTEITGWLVSRSTVGLCAQQFGVLDRALELTAEYATSRVQFGRPIGSFQAVSQRLAYAYAYIDVEGVPAHHAAGSLAAVRRPAVRDRGRHSQVLGLPTPVTGSRIRACTSMAE